MKKNRIEIQTVNGPWEDSSEYQAMSEEEREALISRIAQAAIEMCCYNQKFVPQPLQ